MKQIINKVFPVVLIVAIALPGSAFFAFTAYADDAVSTDSVVSSISAPVAEIAAEPVLTGNVVETVKVETIKDAPTFTTNGGGGTPTPFTAYVYKFLNGAKATSKSANAFGFEMEGNVQSTSSNDSVTKLSYVLGDKNDYQTVFSYTTAPVSFVTSEVTSDTGSVAPVGSTCYSDACIGDIDHDGIVGQSDLNIVLATWSNGAVPQNITHPDVNGDGVVNIDDLVAVVNAWGNCPSTGTCTADVTGNGVVDQTDLDVIKALWGMTFDSTNPLNLSGDVNKDGQVNIDDVLAVINHWGPCPNAKYQLAGYSVGSSLDEAMKAATSSDAKNIDTTSGDKHVIVWNNVCPVKPVETTPVPPTTNGGGNGGSNTGGNGGGSSSSSSSGGSGFGVGGFGEVLGASTCASEYLTSYIKPSAQNDSAQVMKLQVFLNKFMKSNLPINGVYGSQTQEVVKAFQVKFGQFILAPWVKAGFLADQTTGTGHVYKTTKWFINLLECPASGMSQPDVTNG